MTTALENARHELAFRIYREAGDGFTGGEIAEGMFDALKATDELTLAKVRREFFPAEDAKAVADILLSLAGEDISEQASILANAARQLGFAVAIFSKNDCPDDVELESVAEDLEQALVTRGNEFLDQQSPAV